MIKKTMTDSLTFHDGQTALTLTIIKTDFDLLRGGREEPQVKCITLRQKSTSLMFSFVRASKVRRGPLGREVFMA